jgi:hypothetical protein
MPAEEGNEEEDTEQNNCAFTRTNTASNKRTTRSEINLLPKE